ncbi:MAG: outer membrane lipoprotein-sorting protein [bacterium JZ-2024 1]
MIPLVLVIMMLFAIFWWAKDAPEVRASHGLTAKEIIAKSDELLRGNSSLGTVKMTIVHEKWTRTLIFSFWEKNKDRFLVRITSPQSQRGNATLRIGKNLWNYVAKHEKTIKVPPSMAMEPWMGSDFSHNDLIRYDSYVEDYEHLLLEETVEDSGPAYRIQMTARPEVAVEWLKIVCTIHKETFMPIRYEFFSDKGEKVRVMEMSRPRRFGDREVPTVWKVYKVKSPRSYTLMEYEDLRFNVPIEDSIFGVERLPDWR